MRLATSLALLGGFGPWFALAAQSKIFRAISVAEGEVELGKPYALPRSIASRPDDSTIALRRDAYGGAEELLVRHNGHGVIRALLFRYEATTNFAHKLAEYEQALGPPAERHDNGSASHRVIWRDAATLSNWDGSAPPRDGGITRWCETWPATRHRIGLSAEQFS